MVDFLLILFVLERLKHWMAVHAPQPAGTPAEARLGHQSTAASHNS
jgi:hypothetical protein